MCASTAGQPRIKLKYMFCDTQRKAVKAMAKKPPVLRPGSKTPDSGQYEIVGPKGGKVGTEVTAVEGKPLPPTPRPGQGFVLVDKTKHKKK